MPRGVVGTDMELLLIVDVIVSGETRWGGATLFSRAMNSSLVMLSFAFRFDEHAALSTSTLHSTLNITSITRAHDAKVTLVNSARIEASSVYPIRCLLTLFFATKYWLCPYILLQDNMQKFVPKNSLYLLFKNYIIN